MRLHEYEELRKIHEAINEVNLQEDKKSISEKEDMLCSAVKRIIELSNITRKEGLLALEEAVERVEITSMEGFLKQLIILIVDGTDASDVSKMGWSRYYSSLVKDYTALVYHIYIEGALAIQAGDNPRVIEEKLKMLLPNSLYQSYLRKQEKELEEAMREASENIVEKVCTVKKVWNPEDNGYFVMKLADYMIRDLKDMELQRLLREMDNGQIVLVMKGIDGEARRCIFDNLTERLGKEVAEDMMAMIPVRAIDVADAAQRMILLLLELINKGEILDNYKYLEPFLHVVKVDAEKEEEKISKIYELQLLLNEYEAMKVNRSDLQ